MDIYKSSETKLKDTICNEPIYIITQFYLPTNSNRKRELLNSLKLIVYNNMIDKIYLLNERIYSDEELGIQSNKIKQINIEKRLLYSICFDYIEKLSLNGYIIITNSDIFFDKSLMYIKQCNLENEKKVYCQLRHEYDETKLLSECKLFTNNTQKYGRADSQDTWIFHSKYNIPKCNRKIFEFSMGKPGCDNKLVYLWNILGYQCYNEPELIKCYHYHMSNIRNYVQSNSLPGPYRGIYPIIKSSQNFIFSHNYNFKTENQELSSYIEKKIQAKENFIIPRLAGIENNLAHESVLFIKKEITDKNVLLSKIKIMKNNAGIYLSSLNSIINYSQLYLNAFEKCDVYFDWSVFSNVAKYSKNSFPFMYNNFKKKKSG